jgi:hypothetical protein
MNENEQRLQQLLFEKQMIKDYYKFYPNINVYLRITDILSEISSCKRKISQNVKKSYF